MTEKKDTPRGIARHRINTQRSCSLGVIGHKRLERTDHVVRIVDLSVIGVGIESAERIEPGFVWFKEGLSGHKYGVITWIRKSGGRYRAGINFVTLSRDEEQYFKEQVSESLPQSPLRDPLHIIASFIGSIKKERTGTS